MSCGDSARHARPLPSGAWAVTRQPFHFLFPSRVERSFIMDSTRQPTDQRTRLRMERLEDRLSPSIVLVNPGGNTPQSSQSNNGAAIEAQNPAGYAPPGHN